MHVSRNKARAFDGSRYLLESELLALLGSDGDEVRLKIDADVVNAIQALKGVFDAPPSRASLKPLRKDAHLLEARVFGEHRAERHR
jgi:hypothetical protein